MTRKQLSKEITAKLDKLAEALRDVDPARLQTLLRKDGVIHVRVSQTQKQQIEEAAKRLGITTSGYILLLCDLAAGTLLPAGEGKKR